MSFRTPRGRGYGEAQLAVCAHSSRDSRDLVAKVSTTTGVVVVNDRAFRDSTRSKRRSAPFRRTWNRWRSTPDAHEGRRAPEAEHLGRSVTSGSARATGRATTTAQPIT